MKKTPPVTEKVAITPKNLERIKHLAVMMETSVEQITDDILQGLLNDVYNNGRLAEFFGATWTYDDTEEAKRIVGNLQRHDATVPGAVITKWVFVTGDDGRVTIDYPSYAQNEVAA